MFKEHGFKIAFFIYWVMYAPVLIIHAEKLVFDPFLVNTVGAMSIFIIVILSICTFRFTEHPEDYNLSYFSACVFSFSARMIEWIFNIWKAKFEIDNNCGLWITLGVAIIYVIYKSYLKYERWRSNSFLRALFP